MQKLLQDLRFAWRTLRRTPTFPLAAIGTLALGIASTTAIFSTVNAAILRPLPYPDPGDIYALRTALSDGRPTTGLLSPVEMLRLTGPDLPIVRAAGCQPQDITLLRDDGTPLRVRAWGVTEGFFDLFGLPMALGPGLSHAQFAANGPPDLVISYRVWLDLFGRDPAIIGKTIHFVEGSPVVVGVASPDFDTPTGASFWLANRLDPQGVAHNYTAFMRLQPGASLGRTTSQMRAVMAGLAHDYPASDLGRSYVVHPLAESIVGELGPILLVVLSATGVLLLLACVNVTNLLLARGAARGREMAVRVALGASRGRIVRQLLTESLLLATVGGLVGLGAAYAGVRLLLSVGAAKLPRLATVPFDAHVLLFALVTLLVSGVLVGFAPALRLVATDVKTLMNESGRGSSGGRATGRWLAVLTVAEIALAVSLVAGAGWLVRSFETLWTTDPGFIADHRLTFDVALNPRDRTGATVVATFHTLLDGLRALPGVASVGATADFPLNGNQDNSIYIQIEGDVFDPIHPQGTRQRTVSPGWFDTMGIRLLAGRDFTAADTATTTPTVLVNQTFVRRYLANRDPLRARFASGYPDINTKTMFTIVGIVDDVRQRSLTEVPEPAYYNVEDQNQGRQMTVVVHTTLADTTPLQRAIRDEVHHLDSRIPIDFVRATDIVSGTLDRQRLGMTLMIMFGVAAVVLAGVGIYGVIAYAAAERRNEVATRLALGATPGSIFWLVVRQGRTLAGLGAIVGLGVAFAGGRFISSRLYAVRATDPVILGGAVAVVVVIALGATMLPAFRASRLAPSRVLRPD